MTALPTITKHPRDGLYTCSECAGLGSTPTTVVHREGCALWFPPPLAQDDGA